MSDTTHWAYPATARVEHTDRYFGIEVKDPYRWLEQSGDATVHEWIDVQNELTESYLGQGTLRRRLRKRLASLLNYPKRTTPFKAAHRYFHFRNNGLQNHNVLFVQESLTSAAEAILDPNSFSDDGSTAMAFVEASSDGRYLAYGRSQSGSDWMEIRVVEVATRRELPDRVLWAKFSTAAWQNDGFYYSRFDRPDSEEDAGERHQYHKVYYHRLGTDQSADSLVFVSDDTPRCTCYSMVTEDDRLHFIYVSEDGARGNAVLYRDRGESDSEVRWLVRDTQHRYSVVDHIDGKVLMLTDYQAPRWRLVLVDPAHPDPADWRDILPETEQILERVILAGDQIVAEYMQNVTSRLLVFSLDGTKLREIDLPALGALISLSGRKGDEELFYSFSSYTMPSSIFRYDLAAGRSSLVYRSASNFDPEQYVTEQIFFHGADGVAVPMFLSYRKGMRRDGSNPAIMVGYGGFSVSTLPSFAPMRQLFLESGGILVNVCLRGGGEFGEEWHRAGMRERKQNVFNDFIAAAEYLIAKGYTSAARLAMTGGSNGGLLVGAVLTQRPDLFRAAIPQVGVMDMLRFHKFTIGWAWTAEYGSSDDEEQFHYLYAYSPLHNIPDNFDHPATLVITGDHDDRVVPLHSYKFLAELQYRSNGRKPALLRVAKKSGHGAGKPTEKILNEQSDIWTFLFMNLEITLRDRD